ncbi:MAG: glucan 1,4-alpha-glucosidase [Deltaproteobacteria bacterium]|nr:glucan 1,4-alpha-glucosidase [Deltaproteobacteria bacterium]
MSVALKYFPYTLREAFGKPGVAPNWSRASKQGVGTAFSDQSKVWFTLLDGFISEVYYPTIDTANSKDLKFLVTDSKTFFNEEGADMETKIEYIDERAPAFLITNTARSGDYSIIKRVVTDPEANSLIVNAVFKPLKKSAKDYRLFIQFAPHIKNRGFENSARTASYNGRSYLIAWREDITAVLTADVPFLKTSAGFSGTSDGWHDLKDNFQMDWQFELAANGNVALTAEVSTAEELNLVLSFGKDEIEAVLEANRTLSRPYKKIEREYIKGWRGYLGTLDNLGRQADDRGRRFWASAIMLKTHEDKTYKGGLIASLSVPWGETKGDKDASGYHLVWPRDLVKAGSAFLALGDCATAMEILKYLRNTQNADGSWPQNLWIHGAPHWEFVQLDQVALPIMLAWRLKHEGEDVDEFYPMARKAASYIIKHGPVTEQERWEENMGFSPATLAAEISALVCAAHWAKKAGDEADSRYLFSTADNWASKVEEWTFSACDCIGENIPGHYLRIVQETPEALTPAEQLCHMLVFNRNRPRDVPHHQGELVDAGFLELVRYGIRSPEDPNIISSLSVVDKMIRFEYQGGVAFYRFNGDGYGEKDDGSPFDGSGAGRPWPLITGERAMYELLAGNGSEPYLKSFEGFANEGLMFPEQVWDGDDIPEKHLHRGAGTGSATPLMWAHAEYIKILRTKKDQSGCDIIPEVKKRYVDSRVTLQMAAWRKNRPIYIARTSDIIRVVSFERANLLWTADGWETKTEDQMKETGLGAYFIDFKPGTFRSDSKLTFTFHYTDTGAWEGKDYDIRVY